MCLLGLVDIRIKDIRYIMLSLESFVTIFDKFGIIGPVKSVFKPKERYFYKTRPATPKNFKPRPKSGKRYKKRYSYPTPGPRKTVFKYIGCYKYQPRPASPKNFCPRPKSGNRYECLMAKRVRLVNNAMLIYNLNLTI